MAPLLELQPADRPLSETARTYGLDPTIVGQIVHHALPLQMQLIGESPEVAHKMYTASLQMRHGETEAFYNTLAQDAILAAISVDEYAQMFGPAATIINETIAGQVGATPDQVSAVMGAILPLLKQHIKAGIDAEDVDESEFASWAGRQAESLRKDEP